MLALTLYAAFLRATERLRTRYDEAGQTTAEYAMVVVAAAVVGALILVWAGKTSFITRLFDATLRRVVDTVAG